MLLRLDFSADVPIYLQIRNQIVVAIAEGKLTSGEQLPTIRALATEAGINMMTVSKAYQTLKKEGYIATDRRSGAVVTGEVKGALSENTLEYLRVLVAEAKLSGMSKTELLKLCEDCFEASPVPIRTEV
jgi:DNA-binding transcriptional regulator YhcF (GntR family)